MIRRSILKVRKQPKHQRDRYAFGFAIAFTSLVAMVWLYHAPSKISSITSGVEDTAKPFAGFFQQVEEQTAAVKSSLPSTDDFNTLPAEDVSSTPPDGSFQPTVESYNANHRGSFFSTTSGNQAATSTPTTSDRQPVRIITTAASSSATSTQDGLYTQ